MDNKIDEGSVVICPTHQAGTVVEINKGGTWVLLRNGDVWVGELFRVRLPQSQEDLDSCLIDVERLEPKREAANRDF